MAEKRKSTLIQLGKTFEVIDKISKDTGYSKAEIVRKGLKLLLETEQFKKYKE